jgi:hypothetical protein
MASGSGGPGWWQASDGRWYPPQAAPGNLPPPPGTQPAPQIYQRPVPQAPKRRGGGHKGVTVLVVLVALMLIVIVVVASASSKSPGSAATTTTATPSPTTTVPSAPTTTASTATTTPTPAPTTTTAPAPAVVFTESGSGTQTTTSFTVSSTWTLAWSYTCSSFGTTGNFTVTVELKGTTFDTDGPVNQLGPSGSGTQHYHKGGSLYLSVNSECSWKVTATGAG